MRHHSPSASSEQTPFNTLAVVDAKSDRRPAGDGLQQAKEYADILGLKFRAIYSPPATVRVSPAISVGPFPDYQDRVQLLDSIWPVRKRHILYDLWTLA
jgi:hypothetical protein